MAFPPPHAWRIALYDCRSFCSAGLGHAGLVAIFATRFRSNTSGTSNVDFHPAGVIRGVDAVEEPYAASLAFCPKFPPGSEPPWSPGALLAVAWANSGQFQCANPALTSAPETTHNAVNAPETTHWWENRPLARSLTRTTRSLVGKRDGTSETSCVVSFIFIPTCNALE